MSNIERTGKRDLTYSEFLRSCDIACSDLDFIIYDHNIDRIKAIIESKEGFNNYPSLYQHKLYLNISRATKAPYYLIQYSTADINGNKQIRDVKITKGESLIVEGKSGLVSLIDSGDWFLQTYNQHIKWIKNL